MNKLERFQGVIKLLERDLHESYEHIGLLDKKLAEKETEVERLQRVYGVSNQSWRDMLAKLNQAVEALEKIKTGHYVNGETYLSVACKTLQSIKGE